MSKPHLSVLKNAGRGSITYYTGSDPAHVSHLRECKLLCLKGFDPALGDVEIVPCDDPQLEFYKLSAEFAEDYLESDNLKLDPVLGAYIHRDARIGKNVRIGAGSVIANATLEDDVRIDANVTVYAKTVIRSGSWIQAGTVIGPAGVMWVWDGRERVYLEQLGDVVIEEDCRLGSHIVVVRGSANESTVIGKGTCIAHGTMIGHGCRIGEQGHLANGISLGGSVELFERTFVGSGVTVRPGIKVRAADVVLGAGAVVTKDITESGVYVGVPAVRLGDTAKKMSGIPQWNRD